MAIAFSDIPPGQSARVNAWNTAVYEELRRLSKLVAGGDSSSGSGNGVVTTSGETYSDITPTSLITGTVTAAFTAADVSAYVDDNSTHANIWVHGEIGKNGDRIIIDVRSDSGGDTIPAVATIAAQSDVDTNSESIYVRVPLTSAKTFEYRVTGTLGTDAAWELRIVGQYIAN